MDLIDQLHRYLVYAKSADIKVPLDQVTNFGKDYPKMWKTYCEFQEKYAERIALLRLEKREVPKEANADKNMPPILQNWTGKLGNVQSQKNCIHDSSCAFAND